jgi:hypothetical protein
MNFSHFLSLYRSERIDDLIVCEVEYAVAAAVNCRRGRVFWSHDTMMKQLSHHPELDETDYRVLYPAVLRGELLQDTPASVICIYADTHFTGSTYRACLKATPKGLYAVSFCRLYEAKAARLRRKGYPVVRDHL